MADRPSHEGKKAGGTEVTMGSHAATAAGTMATSTERPMVDGGNGTLWSHTEFAWRRAVGPHVAVGEEGRAVSDATLLASITAHLAQFADYIVSPKRGFFGETGGGVAMALVETAGGVCSPAPSGTLQCDVLRPMRLPAVLVGDANLGGISTTISALDVLAMRGYDVVAVVVADGGGGYGNSDAIAEYAGTHGVPTFVLPPVPERDWAKASGGEDIEGWLREGALTFDRLHARMVSWHDARVARLQRTPDDARRALWWPFTQHDMVTRDQIAVIDSRSGEDFGVYVQSGGEGTPGAVQLRFDGAASWWTQGVSKELQSRLVRAASYAAGRWGHVMFPENAHDAAVDAARGLLRGAGRGWGDRVFFSDNGSTAMEVAVKMAIRAYYVRSGLIAGPEKAVEEADNLPQVQVLALDGSYHGDTLGTMDMQAPSVFTGPLQTPWYKPRGLFLNPPVLQMVKGTWVVKQPKDGIAPGLYGVPKWGEEEATIGWHSRHEAFDWSKRDISALAMQYRQGIEQVLEDAAAATQTSGAPPIAALIMECVLHGAGGMNLIDPLFQRILMKVCKERNIPIVLDEVFAGIWRLGAEGAWELLGETPDISCYAKLFTGGLVPLAATVATEEVFEAFRGPSKQHALLHGHSYTAYPVGCSVAAEAMKMYREPGLNHNLIVVGPDGKDVDGGDEGRFRIGGGMVEEFVAKMNEGGQYGGAGEEAVEGGGRGEGESNGLSLRLRELWNEDAVRGISMLPNVTGVTAIGCVLAVEVDDGAEGGGYSSGATREIVLNLRAHSVQARPLGNVLYLMCAPTTDPEKCDDLLRAVHRELTAAAMGEDDDGW